ncbi:ribosome small subunit-dependent GTPase A [Pseudostreptobacillus sp.]
MIKYGKVIRKIKGVYFIYPFTAFKNINDFENSLIQAKLRGNLKIKNRKDNCIIGDIVEFDDELNVIETIKERKNFIDRPLISNIDYIALFFSAKEPDFDIIAFQKSLLKIHKNNLNPILVITKSDLLNNEEKNNLKVFLENNFPYLNLFFISTKNKDIEEFKNFIKHKDVIISGPSGVGKSTLINNIIGSNTLKTNEVSQKTKKGRNTTVDTRFLPFLDGFIIDTPGFSSIEFPKLNDILEIKEYFPEINELSTKCKFKNCSHITEPNCNVKENINKTRYDFYNLIIKNMK